MGTPSEYLITHPDASKSGKVKGIAETFKQPLTKAWLHFLCSIFAILNKFNCLFQVSSTSTVHMLLGESERLLKIILSYYIKPDILRVPIDKLIAADQDITNPTNY